MTKEITKVKLCGLTRLCDIETANLLKPDYIGFVFAPKSKRYISKETAYQLKQQLDSSILAVGVFVNEKPEIIADLLNEDIIDLAQLHGTENEIYITELRKRANKPIIQAFRIDTPEDAVAAEKSSADYILLDSGTGGTGTTFDWTLLKNIKRPYFLAGGLTPENIGTAVKTLSPYGVDVSSGIETNGLKDKDKMKALLSAVRKN